MMTANEVAEQLRLRPGTIRLWTREGIIPAMRLTPKVVRYDLAEVESALRKRSNLKEGKDCR